MGGIAAWSSTELSMGSFKHPGPGFLPFGLAAVLMILALVLILQSWKKEPPVSFWAGRAWLRPLLGILAFGLYAFLIARLGFLPTTFVFLILWMRVIERLDWLRIFLISAGVTAALYLIFSFFLEVPLPAGILE